MVKDVGLRVVFLFPVFFNDDFGPTISHNFNPLFEISQSINAREAPLVFTFFFQFFSSVFRFRIFFRVRALVLFRVFRVFILIDFIYFYSNRPCFFLFQSARFSDRQFFYGNMRINYGGILINARFHRKNGRENMYEMIVQFMLNLNKPELNFENFKK